MITVMREPQETKTDNVQSPEQLNAAVVANASKEITLDQAIDALHIEVNNHFHAKKLADLKGFFAMNGTTTVDQFMKAFDVQPTQLGILRKLAQL